LSLLQFQDQFFANEGDRLVGNFTISNIPIWTDAITKNSETVQYAFKVSKIEGSEKCPTDIVLFEAYQTEHASFDVYCEYSGCYRLRFNGGSGAQDLGIGSMRATLNYDVIKNSSEKQVNISLPTPTPTVPEVPSWTIPLLLTIMVASAGLLVYHKKHKHNLVKKV
jgi:hypothetical protein